MAATKTQVASPNKIIAVVWGTYALFYLGRLNLSPALPAIAESLNISRAQVGSIGTAFFWTYAFGQVVNGELGNHYSPRRIVALGLATIAIVNLLFSFQTSLALMLILWSINGFAQSTGWGPLSRILSEGLDPSQRGRIAAIFPISFQVGTAVSWALAGLMIALGGWRLAFFVPGIFLLFVLAHWWLAGVDAPPHSEADKVGFTWAGMWADWRSFAPVLLSSAFIGFVQIGMVIWGPTYLLDTGLIPEAAVGLMAGIMPLIGIVGMVGASYAMRRKPQPIPIIQVFLLVAGGAMLLAAFSFELLQIAFILLAILLMGGATALVLSSIPLTIAAPSRTSSIAGTINAMLNFGGGLAGVLVGGLVEGGGWPIVLGAWALACLIALLLLGHPLRMFDFFSPEKGKDLV